MRVILLVRVILKKMVHRIMQVFKVITGNYYVSSWKSKGFYSESIEPPSTSDNSLTPKLSYYDNKIRVKFTGNCLKQPKIS